jgi:hypothetical protein
MTMGNAEAVRSLLDQFLEGRSDSFRAKVYELVVRYRWDVNDPSFAILLATGQMELLLQEFPEQFEAMFCRSIQEAQQGFQQLQQWMEDQKGDLRSYIQGLEVQQSQATSQLLESMDRFEQGVAQQKSWAAQEVEKVLAIAAAERTQLETDAKAQLKGHTQAFISAVSKQAQTQVEEMGKVWHQMAFRETVAWTALATAFVFGMGGIAGSAIHQQVINNFTDVPWATQLWEWNQPYYRECLKKKRTTCNFRITPPKE